MSRIQVRSVLLRCPLLVFSDFYISTVLSRKRRAGNIQGHVGQARCWGKLLQTGRDIYSLSDVYSDAVRERDWGTPSSQNSEGRRARAGVLATPSGHYYFTTRRFCFIAYLHVYIYYLFICEEVHIAYLFFKVLNTEILYY